MNQKGLYNNENVQQTTKRDKNVIKLNRKKTILLLTAAFSTTILVAILKAIVASELAMLSHWNGFGAAVLRSKTMSVVMLKTSFGGADDRSFKM